MFQSFIVMLREGLEAALIVGIILAYLRKVGADDRRSPVWLGVLAAVGVSVLMGGLLFWTVGELDGTAEKLYEGFAMLTAVIVLTWMVFWMRRQARTLGNDLRSRVALALSEGSALALGTVAFVATAREGIESSLFLFTATKESSPLAAFVGALLGTITAVAVGVLVYRGTARLDLRQFFTITSVLLFAFAAYLLVGAVEEFAEAGLFGNEELGEASGLVVGLLYAATVAFLYFRRSPSPAKAAA